MGAGVTEITVEVEPNVFRKLSEAADEVGLSVEEFATLVVTNYLNENYEDEGNA